MLLIHLYSIGYMHGDEHFSKFFVYLNLFAFSMLMLVLGDNLLVTFLGWEGVGACSYLLISFWFSDEANATAGKKAFVTNRVGDWGFMVAMFVLFVSTFGSVNYLDIFGNSGALTETTATAVDGAVVRRCSHRQVGPDPAVPLASRCHGRPHPGVGADPRRDDGDLRRLPAHSGQPHHRRVGRLGAHHHRLVRRRHCAAGGHHRRRPKRHQEGVGLLHREPARLHVAGRGNLGAYIPAIFHMVTHAFFKALLFLGSGSVIHGMEDDQDMRHYGGLRKLMPITAITFMIGWLAIAGVPPFAGFWSKDEILVFAWQEAPVMWALAMLTAVLTVFYMSRLVFMTFFGRYRYADVRASEIDEVHAARAASAGDAVTAAEAAVADAEAAVETATSKRDKAAEKLAQRETEMAEIEGTADSDEKARTKATKNLDKARDGVEKAEVALAEATGSVEAARSAVEAARAEAEQVAGGAGARPVPEFSLFDEPDLGDIDAADLPDAVQDRAEHHPHDSGWLMSVPLIVLAALAVFGGGIGLPFDNDFNLLHQWLEPSLFGNETHLDADGVTKLVMAAIAVAGAVVGFVAAVAVYLRGRVPASRVELPVLARGWGIDRAISDFMGGPGRRLFDAVTWFDATVVDGAVNGVGRVVRESSGQLRRAQSGYVRSYAAMVAVGAVLLVAYFLVRASF